MLTNVARMDDFRDTENKEKDAQKETPESFEKVKKRVHEFNELLEGFFR